MQPHHYHELKNSSRLVARYGNTEVLLDENRIYRVVHTELPKDGENDRVPEFKEIYKAEDIHEATVVAARNDQEERQDENRTAA